MTRELIDHFKSSIFKNIFLSYIVIIVFGFIMYAIMNIQATTQLNNNQVLETYKLKLREVASSIDMQLIEGQHMVNSINGSNNINKIYLHTLSTHNPLDAYTLYHALGEIKSIKNASHNINIVEVMVFFNQYNRVYTGSQVIVLKNEFELNEALKGRFMKDTMNHILGTSNMEIVFNKEFLIYAMPYYYAFGSNSNKGMICILYDCDRLSKSVQQVIGDGAAINVYYEDELILGDGLQGEHMLEITSIVNSKLTYKMTMDYQSLRRGFKSVFSFALILGVITTLFYIVLAFLFANRYYEPIMHIEEAMNEESHEHGKKEMERLVSNIKSIIGERNGYKERILGIIPYAKQGILHNMINGSIDSEHMKSLCYEDNIDLKYLYFMIAVMNISYSPNGEQTEKQSYEKLKALLYKTCEKYQDGDTIIATYNYNMDNIYLIINSNFCEGLEALIYTIHKELVEKLQKVGYEVTIGVDEVKDNIEEVSDSCRHALKALEEMISGGRGAIYFYEPNIRGKSGEYYFPKDMSKKITKALKENDLGIIQALWKELYNKNIREEDVSSENLMILMDELYMALLKSIKEVRGLYIVPICIEKLNKVATFEEMLLYYYKILEDISRALPRGDASKKDTSQIERSIIQYIDAHYKEIDMSLAHMTEQFCVSSKSISQACKNMCGMSYLQYIQERRIRYASELIKTTEDTFEQIAMQCGYTNILTFRRNFKTVMGITPSDYREDEK